MRQLLSRHPDWPCEAVSAIEAEAARPRPGLLVLRYRLTADMAALAIPPPAGPARADGLWRHTCFEAFVRAPGAEPYLEFNLAPSGRWAAYRFDSYRQGMAPLEGLDAPEIQWRAGAAEGELAVTLELSQVAGLPADGTWRLGLSAVIEEAGGRTAYWALAHPPGKADFHHDDGFALDLPIP